MSAVLLAHLLALLVLAASPRLHQWLHGDADEADHDCAAVLFSHGGVEQVGGTVAAPGFVVQTVGFAPLAAETARAFVPSTFAGSRVFEHGPPMVG